MTKSGLESLERKSREHIAKADRMSREEVARKQRNLDRELTAKKNAATIGAAGINATGRMLGSLAKINDPRWYKNYIKDLDNFVNIPTFDRLGSIKYGSRLGYIAGTGTFALPGIMIFMWIPTVGPQSSSGTVHFNFPVNQSLTRQKEKVLSLNSRSSTSWEPSDLGFNFFCSADIMSCILELGRVIQVYQTYSATNEYLAKALIEALGWSFSDIEANYAEYRKTYTILAEKFNSAIVAPAGLSLYQRRAFLASNIFIDSGDPKYVRQMYAYVQSKAFTLAADQTFCNMLNINRANLVAFQAHVQLMFSRITDSPDFVEMYQDLRHAYGDKLVKLPTDVSNTTISFNTVDLNKLQIHNSKTLPFFGYDSQLGTQWYMPYVSDILNGFDLRQDSDGYLYQGSSANGVSDRGWTVDLQIFNSTQRNSLISYVNSFYSYETGKHLYNAYSEAVSGDEILDLTRNAFCLETSDVSGMVTLRLTNCGTEVITNMQVYSLYDDGSGVDSYITPISTCYAGLALGRFEFTMSQWASFDWAPISTYKHLSGFANNITQSVFCEAYTTFAISSDELASIHSACVMSELYCPDSEFGFKR